jgi:serine/threonine-protein kinase PknK
MQSRQSDSLTGARPATAAEFGELLRAVQQRHGMQVDEMPVPVSSGSGAIGAQHSGRSPTRRRTAVATLTPPAAATRFRPPPGGTGKR